MLLSKLKKNVHNSMKAYVIIESFREGNDNNTNTQGNKMECLFSFMQHARLSLII